MGDAGRAEEHEPVDPLGLELLLDFGVAIGPEAHHVGHGRDWLSPDRCSG
jgi:hypothetical protein